MSVQAVLFYVAAFIAVLATSAVLLARHAINAVLYLLVSLFAVAQMLYALGGPFVALLQIIVYAGAIVVLFLFVIMMLNVSKIEEYGDLQPPSGRQLLLPFLLAGVLAIDTVVSITSGVMAASTGKAITAGEIGLALYKHHYLGVELASLILLLGLIGGMHLGSAVWEIKAKESK